MVSLKIELDARQARQEAQQVAKDIDTIGRSADTLAPKIDRVGRNVADALDKPAASALKLNRAIESVGEVTQIGSRVRLLGEEVRNLGSGFGSASGVAQTLAGALIDVAQVSEKTGGSLSALAVVLRANPILAAAGVISLIASAMSLFGGETRKTNEELTKQLELQKRIADVSLDIGTKLQRNADLRTAGFQVDGGSDQRLRAEQLVQLATSLKSRQGIIQQGELSDVSGVSVQELLRRAGPGGTTTTPFLGSTFTPDQARTVLLAIAAELRQESEEIVNREASTAARRAFFQGEGIAPGLYGPSIPPGGVPVTPMAPNNLFPDVRQVTGGVGYSSAIGPVPGEESPFARVQRQQEIDGAAAALTEFNERLEQTRQLGQQVGDALGNSFFGFLQNANNARQVLVGLLQQLSAIAQSQIVRGFSNQIGNLFASTQTQNLATTNPNMTGFGPQPGPGFQG